MVRGPGVARIFAGGTRDGLNAGAIRLLHLRPDSSNLHRKNRTGVSCVRYMHARSSLLEDAAACGVTISGAVRLQPPCGGGEPVGILELAREVSAIGKARLDRDFGD
jgi:hypothetical protein